ncbi:ER degradation enhancing alpha-mannosidase like protein 1 [Homo sapiens]|uniref:ER degradation enhancing alpha-mannosidase like protein 1 n=2 Tax=Hominidae TaxID=9604 RepID=F8WE67_HUMAN|nr:ER degradation enhancing alpha-mannosidase like protein 1 [Homo sapiens]KAI4028078.1 ER degradation enhancing alpha-mannosidase like protein 1 [Homo sapiens]PNJ68014.1 EDEM1 isoform 7 [Pongo abelii]
MPAAPARPCNGERSSWGWCSSGLASMEYCGSSSGWGPAWASTSAFRSASASSV